MSHNDRRGFRVFHGAGLIAAALLATGCIAQPLMRTRDIPASCVPTGTLYDPVTWVAPHARRDRTHLDAWCSRVGPPDLLLRSNHTVTATDVVVVTWNVHAGAADIRRFVGELRRGALTDGKTVDAFVLLLQEAYRQRNDVALAPAAMRARPRNGAGRSRGDDRDVRSIARDLGLALIYAPAMHNGNGDREDRGNAILTTAAISNVRIVELPFERQRRLAIGATVAGLDHRNNEWRLDVVSVHFDIGLMITRGGGEAARSRQAKALVDAIGRSRCSTVVAGDLNTAWGEGEPAVRELRHAFPSAQQKREPTWQGPLGLSRQLDYLFSQTRGSLTVARVPESFGSDHHPLLAIVPVGEALPCDQPAAPS